MAFVPCNLRGFFIFTVFPGSVMGDSFPNCKSGFYAGFVMSCSPSSTAATIELPGLLSRRRILAALASLGLGSAVFSRALAAQAEEAPRVTTEMIRQAEWIAGLEFSEDERSRMLQRLNRETENLAKLRAVPIDNSVPPALTFRPGAAKPSVAQAPHRRISAARPRGAQRPARPRNDEDMAFLPLYELAELVRARQVSSLELTTLYLDRLRRFDPVLRCVITLLEEPALDQAARADREIAAGRYRGPLHGIPWGAKDLFALPGHPTTWGAKPYENQMRGEKAAVIERLEDAGAVLLAKLALGALAMGDVWYGGKTRNPWKPEQGSSGSSAGSAAAAAAGLAGFTLGTETLGSIVSPCARCGVSGLRPTFGRVSRHGAMALAWSMDKVGPMARSAEDCALVFHVLHGMDPRDPSTVDRPFEWPPAVDWTQVRVGYVEALFDDAGFAGIQDSGRREREKEERAFDRRTLETLYRMSREMGFRMRPIRLPDAFPIESAWTILTAEAAAAFDDLTRSGGDDRLTRQDPDAWPTAFRVGQLTSAVDYIRAHRIRTMILREMEELMSSVDVYVAPSFGPNLPLTNITGHPSVVVPNGFRAGDGTPASITLTGKLFGESTVLALARAYQQRTDYHRRHPPLERAAPAGA